MNEHPTPDPTGRRDDLLAKIVDHVIDHGIAQITLRSLATAVGSNNRMLLYYFGSREELIVTALHGAESRFPTMALVAELLDDRSLSLAERIGSAWDVIALPENLPFHRLFFEIFGLAGFERERFEALLGLIGTEWVQHVAAAFEDAGLSADEALDAGHETVALWRGLQASLLSLGDGAVVRRAAANAHAGLVARATRP
ncbi:TetR family transcriptional regulator [Frondihabitans sp. PhB188]|uniref:TetR/AcrR family transcriptional regulator n=1 Tax=Frondihabitans sp. PhB188 TaxID=2485200 RepID=UPI000F48EB0F|nr:TetR/AcrR family transcriptional regulator [Frondihabitans sp. PhB188]ROQ38555.1 TetR family transcriptional regulator [Frondihabitans sp. PhB188]